MERPPPTWLSSVWWCGSCQALSEVRLSFLPVPIWTPLLVTRPRTACGREQHYQQRTLHAAVDPLLTVASARSGRWNLAHHGAGPVYALSSFFSSLRPPSWALGNPRVLTDERG